MFKKIIVLLFAVVFVAKLSYAFPFDLVILDKTAIANLSDEQLLSNYIDAEVEVEALKAFYAKGGFVPKEYKSFKEELRYKILLLDEIQRRGLRVPGAANPPAMGATPAEGNNAVKDNSSLLIKGQ